MNDDKDAKRDFAGALGSAESAMAHALKYMNNKDYFNAERVLKESLSKIEEICPSGFPPIFGDKRDE